MKFHYKIQNMQKIMLLLLFSVASFAQVKDSVAQKKLFQFDETFSMYIVSPQQIGNHTLAKDYNNGVGFGSRLTLFSVKNFNLGGGGEIVVYQVTNRSNAGNFSKGTYKNAFVLVNYPIQVAPNFTLTPSSAVGLLQFTQRQRGTRHSHQEGINYRLGVSADYEVGKELDFFIGLDFIYTKFRLKANPEIIDYFGHSNNLQLSLGLRFKAAKKSIK